MKRAQASVAREKTKKNVTLNESGKNTGKVFLLKPSMKCVAWDWVATVRIWDSQGKPSRGKGENIGAVAIERHDLQLMGAERAIDTTSKNPNSTAAVLWKSK